MPFITGKNYKIYNDDSLKRLKKIENNSIDLILTDPPYFIDKLDNNWNAKKINKDKPNSHITHLPKGMKFNKEQTKNLYDFYLKISKLCFEKLKPGGFFLSFSSPRLYHAIAMAVDIAGFEIRDAINWIYTQSMPKGMSIVNQIRKSNLPEERKKELLSLYKNFKTPMIKSCFEPICVAVKPIIGTYFKNELSFNTGLLDFSQKVGDNKVPSNVITTESIDENYDRNFLVKKPSKKEKGDTNNHPTVKPIHLLEHLIKLFSKKGAIVLDPFLGSGTTAIACLNTNRKHIGIEINKEYYDICKKRIKNE